MAVKPWYKVVTPREDLREGKPLDASEFAVHLDRVRDGKAHHDYQDPVRFFERTYLTQNLTDLGAEVIRRLSGEITETSAIFNMSTQFGGGKTHALTMLYHHATHGREADGLSGVNKLLTKSGVTTVPQAATAVFVGTEFDSITGRGGNDGTPLRKTPWGEIAFQLGGEKGFAVVAEHEKQMIAPGGDVIRNFLPKERPSLILMDEVMNYVSRSRKSGLSNQLYDFLQNLSETARSEKNVVLVVSIPKSEVAEMTSEDEADYTRFKHLLNRLGKAMIISSESEISEIIRRRLFEWDPKAVSQEGKVMLHKDAIEVCNEYADWLAENRAQIPNWFPADNARSIFASSYPFHPIVLSVFERKWQALPRFQKTRGILRLLALWVSKAYQDGYKGAHKDALIGLGTAPLDDPLFRVAVFEQLGGETVLEGIVTTDICGKQDSFAIQMDKEATDAIKQARLHRKVATTIFFESNGGVVRHEATMPEIRLAVAEPGLEIGNIETVLEEMANSCYFLSVEKNRYRFSISPNLNKILADRLASVKSPEIDDCVRSEIQKVFAAGSGIERVFFPEKSSQIPDRPALTFVVLPPERSLQEDKKLLSFIEGMTREYGTSARTFKSALVWCVPDSSSNLRDDARKFLAWEAILDEKDELKLDEVQRRQLAENLKKAERDFRESVWRTYKNIALLAKDNTIHTADLGLIHSSGSPDGTIVGFILQRLRQDGDVEKDVSPNFITRHWPPAFKEWSTKSLRDAFFASPLFPRLLNAEVIKDTIARGVSNGLLAYVGKKGSEYEPFVYGRNLNASEVEISDDMFIIMKETAENYKTTKPAPAPQPGVPSGAPGPVTQEPEPLPAPTGAPATTVTRMTWNGDVPPQKWMNFYTKILSKFASGSGLKITMQVEISQPEGISSQKIEETKVALRELGLGDEVEVG